MKKSTTSSTRRGPSYCVMGLLILAIMLLAGITIWQFLRVTTLYSKGQADLTEIKSALSSLEKYAKKIQTSSEDENTIRIELVDPAEANDSISSVEDVVAIVQSANSQSLATINNYLMIFSILIAVVVFAIPIFNYLFIQKEQIERLNIQYAEYNKRLVEETAKLNDQYNRYEKHLVAETEKLNEQYEKYENHLTTELDKVKKSIEMMQAVISNSSSGQEKGDRATEIALIKPISDSNQDKAFAHKVKAQVFASKNQHDSAIDEITKAIGLVPDNAEYYDYRSYLYHNINNYEQALIDARKAIELDPSNALYYNSRGVTLHELKRCEEALADKNKAIELDPSNAEYYDSRAKTLLKLKRYETALRDAKKAIELDASDQDYRADLAFSLYLNNDYVEALNYIDTIDTTFSSYIVYRVRALATLKKLISAHKKVTLKQKKQILDDLKEAIQISPDNQYSYIYYAQVLLELDEFEDARKELEKARELDPEEPETYHWLGVYYRKIGNNVNAELNDKIATEKGYIPEPN